MLFCILLPLIVARLVQGFSFNTSTPTQCGQLTVQWTGGQEPFYVVLVPTTFQTAGRIRNITIPNGSNGRYSFELNEPAGLRLLATMGDATGWGTGGTTPILTVGSSANSSCLDPNLLYDFTFSITPETAPNQCSNVRVTWNDNVTYPVSLFGLIPSGTAWSIPIPQTRGQNTVDWQANIRQNTQFLLLMSNGGQYQTGGSTNLFTVGGGDGACITDSSPRSFATGNDPNSSGGTQNVQGVGGGSSGGTTSGNDNNGGSSGGSGGGGGGGGSSTPVGAIVGGTVGGVAFIVLLALLLVCCLRRRVRERRGSDNSGMKNYGVGTEKRRPVDLLSRRAGSTTLENGVQRENSTGNRTVEVRGEAYRPSPFRYPSPPELPTTAGLAAAAGAGGMGNRVPPTSFPAGFGATTEDKGLPSPRTTTGRPSTERPSGESERTATGTTTNEASLQGLTGRRSSIMKHTHTPSAASNPITGSGGNTASTNTGSTGAHTPEHPRQDATFVEHADAGPAPVIDLPPRYDQLRARNPDQANT